jgi:hypothetical protein
MAILAPDQLKTCGPFKAAQNTTFAQRKAGQQSREQKSVVSRKKLL